MYLRGSSSSERRIPLAISFRRRMSTYFDLEDVEHVPVAAPARDLDAGRPGDGAALNAPPLRVVPDKRGGVPGPMGFACALRPTRAKN
ncbi:MAG: hypothetical protein IJQ00_09065 [Kiritimatiellae bacterium]|nr:hypothetical protein [Kiritimatiellia bacterium]